MEPTEQGTAGAGSLEVKVTSNGSIEGGGGETVVPMEEGGESVVVGSGDTSVVVGGGESAVVVGGAGGEEEKLNGSTEVKVGGGEGKEVVTTVVTNKDTTVPPTNLVEVVPLEPEEDSEGDEEEEENNAMDSDNEQGSSTDSVPIAVTTTATSLNTGTGPSFTLAPLTTTVIKPKRKYNSTGRKFNQNWLVDYFMMEKAQGVICLICQKSLAGKKKHNISRHYNTTHEAEYKILTGKTREEIANMMKNSLLSQGTLSQTAQLDFPNLSELDGKLSNLFASHGVTLTNGDFVKQCLEVFSVSLYPEAVPVIQHLTLSPESITEHLTKSSASLTKNLLGQTRNSSYYSLALCSGVAMEDPSQLALFAKGFSSTGHHFEELLDICQVNHATTGKDILTFVKSTLNHYGLPLSNLTGVTTDVAPVMVNLYTEFTTALVSELTQEVFIYNNLYFQDRLCDNVLSADHLLNKILSVVEALKTRPDTSDGFQHFLIEFENQYFDATTGTLKRLGRYGFLSHFWNLIDEVKSIAIEVNPELSYLNDPEWLNDLAFFIDLTQSFEMFFRGLHDTSLKIDKTLHQFVTFFQNLKHLQSKLTAREVTEFGCLATRSSDSLNFDKYSTLLAGVIYLFDSSFNALLRQSEDIDLFSNPFVADVNKVQPKFQLELIDIQSHPDIKRAFLNYDQLTFYTHHLHKDKFPATHRNATILLTLFGGIHLFDTTFHKLKRILTHLHPVKNHDQLVRLLRLATTTTSSPSNPVA